MLVTWGTERKLERKNDDNIGLLGLEVKNISGGVQIDYVLKKFSSKQIKSELKSWRYYHKS